MGFKYINKEESDKFLNKAQVYFMIKIVATTIFI